MSKAFYSLSVLLPCVLCAVELDGPKDYTKTTLKSLDIEPVKPTKDKKTGFVVGGKNATDLILGLKELAGLPIDKLEKSMRPGALSDKGFLGKEERLLDIMAEDNRFVVEKRGLTHQELALHLHIVGGVAVKHGRGDPIDFLY